MAHDLGKRCDFHNDVDRRGGFPNPVQRRLDRAGVEDLASRHLAGSALADLANCSVYTQARWPPISSGQAYLDEQGRAGTNKRLMKLGPCTYPERRLQMSGNSWDSMPGLSPPDSGSLGSAPGPAGAGQPASSDRRRHTNSRQTPNA
jgi:hypothetical protein